jgi:polyisoprenyl-phosphate glycosyltransferase
VVPGWTSITMLIILTSATQLMVLSVLGEYVGRAYLEVKRRPLFIVDQIVRSSDASHKGQDISVHVPGVITVERL